MMDDVSPSRPAAATAAAALLFGLGGVCGLLTIAALGIPASEEPGTGVAWEVVSAPAAGAVVLVVMAIGMLTGRAWSQVGAAVTAGVVAAFPFDVAATSLTATALGEESIYGTLPPVLLFGFLALIALATAVAVLASSGSVLAWCRGTDPGAGRGRHSAGYVAATGGGLLLAIGVPPLLAPETAPEPDDPAAAASAVVTYAPVLLLAALALVAVIGMIRVGDRGRVLATPVCAVVIMDLATASLGTSAPNAHDFGHVAGLAFAIPVLVMLTTPTRVGDRS